MAALVERSEDASKRSGDADGYGRGRGGPYGPCHTKATGPLRKRHGFRVPQAGAVASPLPVSGRAVYGVGPL